MEGRSCIVGTLLWLALATLPAIRSQPKMERPKLIWYCLQGNINYLLQRTQECYDLAIFTRGWLPPTIQENCVLKVCNAFSFLSRIKFWKLNIHVRESEAVQKNTLLAGKLENSWSCQFFWYRASLASGDQDLTMSRLDNLMNSCK